jgi:hypothetical protein
VGLASVEAQYHRTLRLLLLGWRVLERAPLHRCRLILAVAGRLITSKLLPHTQRLYVHIVMTDNVRGIVVRTHWNSKSAHLLSMCYICEFALFLWLFQPCCQTRALSESPSSRGAKSVFLWNSGYGCGAPAHRLLPIAMVVDGMLSRLSRCI